MARFYGTLMGSAKTPVSRIGHASSGVRAHIRGWDVGASVSAHADLDDEDRITITLTKGSNNPTERPFAMISRHDKGFRVTLMTPDGKTHSFIYD
jgi:hypothetical protein